MRRGEHVRPSGNAAKEFLAGIQWSNDSSVAAWIDPLNPNIVLTEDSSYEQEDDRPWPSWRRAGADQAEIEKHAKRQHVTLPLQLRVEVMGGCVTETRLTDHDGVELRYELELDDKDGEQGA